MPRFSTRIEPLTRSGSLGETELLLNRWVGGFIRRTLGDALIQLREIVNSRMDKLYDERGIEKPLRIKASEKDQRQPVPRRKPFSKDGLCLGDTPDPGSYRLVVEKRSE